VSIAVVGAGGMLGRALVRELQNRGIPFTAWTRTECDITNLQKLRVLLTETRPLVVINCAAYTDVNGAESHEDAAHLVNGVGAENVALAAAEIGARSFYVSTDYVFDGTKPEPYLETDPVNPINAYGRTKLEGEQRTTAANPHANAIFRTSWLYGPGAKNFVDTMRNLPPDRHEVRVVADQVGAPTYVVDLARVLADCATLEPVGIYHATGGGACSWYEFAREIFRLTGRDRTVIPVSSTEYPTPARRPANSRLANTRLTALGVDPLPLWKDALRRYLAT